MPELPEVHTISSDLNEHISGYTIARIKIAPGYSVFPDNATFIDAVVGTKIASVSRIAKNIVVGLETGQFLVFHLAMTGRLLLRQEKDKKDRWVKVLFELKKDPKLWYLKFTDMRTFGKVKLVDAEKLQEIKAKYGPEPIQKDLSPTQFWNQITSKRTNIKNALLDQKIISGLGNIYATDALFMAGVHPETKTSNISEDMADKLLEAARNILQEGIQNRGSTLPDKMYVDIFGKEGTQQNYFRVYMRETCINCSGKVQFIKLNGRGTYYCPSCQPLNGQKTLF